MTTIKLRISDAQHGALMDHLLPGDGLEAIAVALCGRRPGETAHCLTARTVVSIPYDECRARTPDRVTWSSRRLVPLLEEAARRDLAVLKVHSHPDGYGAFSEVDDAADKDLFGSVFGWTDSEYPHATPRRSPAGGCSAGPSYHRATSYPSTRSRSSATTSDSGAGPRRRSARPGSPTSRPALRGRDDGAAPPASRRGHRLLRNGEPVVEMRARLGVAGSSSSTRTEWKRRTSTGS